VADVKILAKQTLQIAMGKKNRTGTVVADQGLLLPKMRAEAGYPGELAGIAKPCFARQPVNAAFSGTKHAGFQKAASFGRFFL